jgi:serine/threonine protein phosphatase PrpC
VAAHSGEGGLTIGGHKVLTPAGSEGFTVQAGGDERWLVIGPERALQVEQEALGKVKAGGAVPGCHELGHDERRGTFLLLDPAPAGSVSLANQASALSVPETFVLVREALGLLAALEKEGFRWEPLPGDFLVLPTGQLRVTRLRGAARLPRGAVIDARALLRTLGVPLSPVPAVAAPIPLVRLLMHGRDTLEGPARSATELLVLLDEIEHLAPPAGERLAEICDPGLWRPYNQDSTASAQGELAGEPWVVIVVCDGVSSSRDSDKAAEVAARTTRDVLAHFARSGDIQFESATAAMATAIRSAHLAVCTDAVDRQVNNPPGTTIVAALIHRRRLILGWVGDSRAYWVTPRGAELLSRDHSWVNEAIDRGEMTEAEAMTSPHAHTITRCLGPLEAGEVFSEAEPDVKVRELLAPGVLMLCSDGLWNYTLEAETLARVIEEAGPDAPAGVLARRLINHALVSGGHDNVSVSVYVHRLATDLISCPGGRSCGPRGIGLSCPSCRPCGRRGRRSCGASSSRGSSCSC